MSSRFAALRIRSAHRETLRSEPTAAHRALRAVLHETLDDRVLQLAVIRHVFRMLRRPVVVIGGRYRRHPASGVHSEEKKSPRPTAPIAGSTNEAMRFIKSTSSGGASASRARDRNAVHCACYSRSRVNASVNAVGVVAGTRVPRRENVASIARVSVDPSKACFPARNQTS